MALIKGGYYIKARKIQESKIAHFPPHVREIWDWLLKECNHKPKMSSGRMIERGQCVRTYKDIQNGLHWMVGWRKQTYSKWDCEKAMKVLREATMITTEKTTRGMIITVMNYDYYQNPKNYESHEETDTKATRKPQSTDTINKNEKNEKNIAEVKTSPEVNSLMGVFKKLVNPNLNFANKTERKACENLLKDHSLKAITENLELIAEHQQKGTPYMPVVTTPYELYNKWAKLVIFFNKQNDT